MKKFITSIIVSALLLELFGCYSMTEMSVEELKNYYGPDDIKIKTDQKEVLIYRKSSGVSSMNWEPNDSLIIIETKKLIALENKDTINTQSTQIKYSEINSIEIGEIDGVKTALFTIGVVAIAGIIVGLITISEDGLFKAR